MAAERDYWVETVGKTHLYYKVRARSKEEALENIREAIELYLEPVEDDQIFSPNSETVELAV